MDTPSAPAERAESETRGSSHGSAVKSSSAPAGRTETEVIGSSQGGAVGAPSVPAERAETKRRGSLQGGAVDVSSAPAGRAECDLSAASTSDIDQGNCEDPPRKFWMVYVPFSPW